MGDDIGSGFDFTLNETSEVTVRPAVRKGKTVDNLLFRPMVRVASTGDDTYGHYKALQTVELTRTLPGIPVTSGGNYTDASGQQWICDDVDLERVVYVQRIGVIERYAGEDINGVFMSTTGELTEGATVLHILSAPIETPLSASEIAAYHALHTNKPNTTILNDSGAHMKVEYAADTKLYIDNKIAALVGNN